MEIKFGIEILIAAGANFIAIVAGIIHITNRITEIHTDVKWIKKSCPKCQLNSEDPTP